MDGSRPGRANGCLRDSTPGRSSSSSRRWCCSPWRSGAGSSCIIFLGETLLISGATFAEAEWTRAGIAAFAVNFLGSVAMWWLYFHIGQGARGVKLIEHSEDPGRVARDRLHLRAHSDRGRHRGQRGGGGADDRAPGGPRRLGRGRLHPRRPGAVPGGQPLVQDADRRAGRRCRTLWGSGCFAAAAVIVPWISPLGLGALALAILILVAGLGVGCRWAAGKRGGGGRLMRDLGVAALQHRADAEPARGDGGPAGGGGRARVREPPDPARERQPDLRGRCAGCAGGRGASWNRPSPRPSASRSTSSCMMGAAWPALMRGNPFPEASGAGAGAGGGAGDARAGAGRRSRRGSRATWRQARAVAVVGGDLSVSLPGGIWRRRGCPARSLRPGAPASARFATGTPCAASGRRLGTWGRA